MSTTVETYKSLRFRAFFRKILKLTAKNTKNYTIIFNQNKNFGQNIDQKSNFLKSIDNNINLLKNKI